MDHISDAELRGACPHCGQHFSCDPAWAGRQLPCPSCQRGFLVPNIPAPLPAPLVSPVAAPSLARHFRCPRCGAQLGLFQDGQNPTDCSRCGWHRDFAIAPEHPDLPSTRAQRLSIGFILLVIGAASPVLVFLSMGVTILTGPLALILAPILGFLCANLLCRFVYQRTGPHWYWYYVASGLLGPLLILVWPKHPQAAGGVDNGAAFAAPALAIGALLWLAGIVLWLLAAVYAWFRARHDSSPPTF